jgi:hypothetical protein
MGQSREHKVQLLRNWHNSEKNIFGFMPLFNLEFLSKMVYILTDER